MWVWYEKKNKISGKKKKILNKMLLSLLILPLIGVFLSFKPNSYYNNYYMNVIRGKNVSYYDFEKKKWLWW